jgi:TFIIF-interacting CTD phosphatase-like protein
VGEHKDLRFVTKDIDRVIIVDDYPPYIKQTQKHRLVQIKQYLEPYTHAMPDMQDNELEVVLRILEELLSIRGGG